MLSPSCRRLPQPTPPLPSSPTPALSAACLPPPLLAVCTPQMTLLSPPVKIMEDTSNENLRQKLRDNYDNHDIFLRDKGKEVLKQALLMHFTAAHLDDHLLVSNLVKVNLSRCHLKNAFQELYAKKLIQIFKVRNDEGVFIDKRGTGYSLHDYATIFSISGLEDLEGKVLMKSLEGIEKKLTIKKVQLVNWEFLNKIDGFKSSMHNLALQVAGLMHVADASTFWEKYKPYMKLISKDNLLKGQNVKTQRHRTACFTQSADIVWKSFMGYFLHRIICGTYVWIGMHASSDRLIKYSAPPLGSS